MLGFMCSIGNAAFNRSWEKDCPTWVVHPEEYPYLPFVREHYISQKYLYRKFLRKEVGEERGEVQSREVPSSGSAFKPMRGAKRRSIVKYRRVVVQQDHLSSSSHFARLCPSLIFLLMASLLPTLIEFLTLLSQPLMQLIMLVAASGDFTADAFKGVEQGLVQKKSLGNHLTPWQVRRCALRSNEPVVTMFMKSRSSFCSLLLINVF